MEFGLVASNWAGFGLRLKGIGSHSVGFVCMFLNL